MTPWGNRILFTGREYLSDMRIYDFRNRVYHPELGRFLQPDPIQFKAGDYNLYRYCHNDPVNHTDPMGTDHWNWKTGTITESSGELHPIERFVRNQIKEMYREDPTRLE